MDNNQQSFWRFGDRLRVESSNMVNLSSNDSIWSNSYGTKNTDERRKFDIRVGGEVNSLGNLKAKDSPGFNDGWKWNSFDDLKPKAFELNGFDDGWNSLRGLKAKGSDLTRFRNALNNFKLEGSESNDSRNSLNNLNPEGSDLNSFDDGWSSVNNPKPKGSDLNLMNGWKMGSSSNDDLVVAPLAAKDRDGKNKGEDDHGVRSRKKNNGSKKKSGDNKDGNENKSGVEKKYKTLPAAESLPRNETIGGYIFVCNNDTMQENLKRKLFGLPPRYRDSVRQITPGLPLFLYNYTTHQLHGIFEAASFGGTNIDASAWEDKKCPGESRFPAQVRVVTRKTCEPLEEDSFRPILHHYDGPKFRLELNIPEALSVLDKFDEQNHP